MYFSRIEQRDGQHMRPLATLGQVHSKAYNFFGEKEEGRKRDFLFRYEVIRGRGRFYMLSRTQPRQQEAWRVATKVYEPQLAVGDRLHFDLKASPTVSVNRKHHDLVYHYLIKHPEAKERHRGALTTELVHGWLTRQGERCGFTVEQDSFRVDRYEKERFTKVGKKSQVTITVAEMCGVLTVTDPKAFCDMLSFGIGRSKGYGCGLMMIRRI